MPVSASKAKRQAEKAAKAAAKGDKTGASSSSATAVDSSAGDGDGTKAVITDMKQLALATERTATGVLVSDPQSRDVHIDQFTMSFHGRLLIDGAKIELNYGQR